MSEEKPRINDIVKIICAGASGEREELMGRLEGYQANDMGEYVKLRGHPAIFAPSIIDWKVLERSVGIIG